MGKTFDEVVIHAGLEKTGSSFLQSALESIELKEGFLNVTYPVIDPRDDFQFIRSGNGVEIAKILVSSWSPAFDESKLRIALEALLEKRSPNKRKLLISSEWFAHACPERFKYFVEELYKLSARINIVVYIRPFVPWAWSLYCQRIKRHNLSETFEEWASQNIVGRFDQFMTNLFGFKVDIKVLPFIKNDLLTMLLNVLSESRSISEMVPNLIVNRSLTEIETNFLLQANKSFNNPELSTAISDLFIKSMPDLAPKPLSSELAQQAEEYLPEVVNNLKKYDEPTVTEIKEILLADYRVGESLNASSYEKTHTHDIVKLMFSAILKHYSSRETRLSKLMDYSEKLNKNQTHFDPIHYLLLNPDVLDAEIDPFGHFESFGLIENRFTSLTDKK